MQRIVFENRSDEPFRTFGDGCVGTIRTIDSGGDKRVLEVKVIGQMDNTIDHTFESANRVYDTGGGVLLQSILVEVVVCNRKLLVK